jgi:hypothetical protein
MWSRVVAITLVAVAPLLSACAAVYPELKTPMRDARAGQVLDPAPPSDLKWIGFKGAKIPALSRDGRSWGNELSGAPDPYAKLIVNGMEVIRTNAQKRTLEPTWPDSPAGNFRLQPDDRVRIEIWDARVINDHPIGMRDVGRIDTNQVLEELEVETDSGVRVRLAIEPAHGILGYGFYYELRTYDVFVTRVFEESPAARAGIRAGDQLLAIEGRAVRAMTEDQVRSALNTPRMGPLRLTVRHQDGAEVSIKLAEGAIYPLFRETRQAR